MNYLGNARKFFDEFRDTHLEEYRDIMRTYRIHPNNGFQFFNGSDEVTQTMVNICGNLEETYETTDIPGKFVTPRKLVESWIWFRGILIESGVKFDEIRNALIKERCGTSDVALKDQYDYLPVPFLQIDKVRREVIDLLDHVLEMDEVKQVMGQSSEEKHKSVNLVQQVNIEFPGKADEGALPNQPVKKAWHETGPGKIAIPVIGGIIVALVVAYIITPHVPVSQAQAIQTPTQTPKSSAPARINSPSVNGSHNTVNQTVNRIQADGDVHINVTENHSNASVSPVLNPQQERLLELLSDYQRQFGANKLVISRTDGRLFFDDSPQRGAEISFIKEIFGLVNDRNAGKFEELVEGMPSEYVNFIGEARLNNPFVISIKQAGSAYLNERRKFRNNQH